MNKSFYGFCYKCKRKFAKENDNDEHCNPCKQIIEDQKGKTPNRLCRTCGEEFYSPNHLVKCQHCKELGYETGKPPKDYTEINLKTRKKPKKTHSFTELNRKMEYKRVWDDKGWKHYLKGRKWDRI